MRVWSTAVSFLSLLALLTSCGKHAAVERGYARSPEELGRAVVEVLNSSDVEGMHRLRVTREDYTKLIYPGFEASHYRSGFPADFAWENLNKKCLEGAKKWIRHHGGQDLEFVSIRFEKPTESFDGFQRHPGTVLTVRKPGEDPFELRILGSVIEAEGTHKFLSYDD